MLKKIQQLRSNVPEIMNTSRYLTRVFIDFVFLVFNNIDDVTILPFPKSKTTIKFKRGSLRADDIMRLVCVVKAFAPHSWTNCFAYSRDQTSWVDKSLLPQTYNGGVTNGLNSNRPLTHSPPTSRGPPSICPSSPFRPLAPSPPEGPPVN